MKRKDNIYKYIYSLENLRLADKKARKGKQQNSIKDFDKNKEANLLLLQEMLMNKTYKTSAYTTFIIHEPKEREIFRLPYFPDRIAHHAAMNPLQKIFTDMFTADTYSCIKGKGQIKIGESYHVAFTGSTPLIAQIEQIKEEDFPFKTTVKKDNDRYEFT